MLPRTSLPALALLALGSTLALTACPGAGAQSGEQVSLPPINPGRAIHLRAAFDDDPSAYVGRFVPDSLAAEQLDETAAAQTRCSEFFVAKVVNSNQEVDEVVYTSTKVAGAIGIKPIAALSGQSEKGSMARLKYTLEKRMQVTVKDPAGLARCCASAPDQCSKNIIGEFLLGSGEVYQAAGAQSELEAQSAAKKITGEFSFKDGVGWKRVNGFKHMYFAFLTTPARVDAPAGAGPGAADDCSWCDNIPPSPDGKHFCGVSPPAPSEAMARDLAMRNAREQVVKLLGESIATQSSTEASLIKGYLDDKQVTTAAASGVAAQVKDVKWCKAAASNTPEGQVYTSKVLAFLAEADRQKAAQVVLDAMIAKEGMGEKGDDKAKAPKPKAGKPSSKTQALEKLKGKVK
jgi:hypothetical protein